VRLSPKDVVWVSGEDIRLLPRGTAVPRAIVGPASYSVLSDRIRLAVNINNRIPFKVEQSLAPAVLYLYLYGAHQGYQWMTYPERDQTVSRVSWTQPSDNVYCLRVELNQKQQWGYRVFYGGGRLNLDIRRTPNIAKPPQSPVARLIFALDPGHGGDEPGAVGPTGLEEKAVNLTFAEKLASLLRDAGAEVVLTREDDSTVTLKERVEIARQARAHIFVMMHNNSVGIASDPMIRGASTYYTQPHSQELAWAVYPRLKQIGLAPFGKVFSSYYITRQTDMLYFLVEGAFMSNPEDEMLLMDEVFIGKMVKAVLDGIEDFLKMQVE
jgi:N-acetylmuramoyl-L-alanine amidase